MLLITHFDIGLQNDIVVILVHDLLADIWFNLWNKNKPFSQINFSGFVCVRRVNTGCPHGVSCKVNTPGLFCISSRNQSIPRTRAAQNKQLRGGCFYCGNAVTADRQRGQHCTSDAVMKLSLFHWRYKYLWNGNVGLHKLNSTFTF